MSSGACRASRIPALWLPVLGTVTVGVSFGLPLYLYLRERASTTDSLPPDTRGTEMRRAYRCAVLLGCVFAFGCGDGNPILTLTPTDYSNFSEFVFQQSHGLGFCPRRDIVYSAGIRRDSVGGYSYEATVLVEGEIGVDECVTYLWPDSLCLTTRMLPNRELDNGEVELVRSVFKGLLIDLLAEPVCRDLGIDPCLITVFTWDGQRHTDYVCSFNRLIPQQRESIVDLLEVLRNNQ